MEAIEAKILLKNLLKRIRQVGDDEYELNGSLTDDEMAALKLALAVIDGTPVPAAAPVTAPTAPAVAPLKPVPIFTPEPTPAPEIEEPVEPTPIVPVFELDTSVLSLPEPPEDRRLCLDFGTAMSKVALVRDATSERDYEDIEVLKLGVPGDQEEVSFTMLVSSVFIDGDGLLWFGQMAVERSRLEEGRKRLDNIKHYLSVEGDGLNSVVTGIFNPTEIEITYGDMVLAYLMFLTWTVNHCLEDIEEPRNLPRRFAMPCFNGAKSTDMAQRLGEMLGDAQILADTFFSTLQKGIPLSTFVEAVSQLRNTERTYSFLKEAITEPLGVAGSIMSWQKRVNSLVMVVDVGAGTSDFSLYRMHFDEKEGKSVALEVNNSSQGITEAGNYLDTLLRGLILKNAGVTSGHEHWVNILGSLELDLRDYKERLFQDGEVSVRLFTGDLVSVMLDDFMSLDQVRNFGDSLKACRDEILNRIDSSWIEGAPHGALGLALTGGGASLPMVRSLAEGTIEVHEKKLKLVQTKEFPTWLEEEYPDLEADYPRIAVSLGGARKRILDSGGIAKITAGGHSSSPTLGGYYTKGE
ncbi:hypothetical protein DWB85_12460 [Seongchinamella sediminis]|uniref:Uncharacterized protein n=1 Tax=Seongchinamella sediminis TaxID=2283635 RepID=A0A3L7DZY4_9GAMM|nr:hypothetical protein [Seongchinamella sediminis]RLQ21561.1 hypothetical protein DWB85_12460 [Seongchinamella sediminis]